MGRSLCDFLQFCVHVSGRIQAVSQGRVLFITHNGLQNVLRTGQKYNKNGGGETTLQLSKQNTTNQTNIKKSV